MTIHNSIPTSAVNGGLACMVFLLASIPLLLTTPYNRPYEHFSPDGDEHYIVSFPFIENEYHYDILLSFNNKCKCLAPHHICEEMKRRIQDIAGLYEN